MPRSKKKKHPEKPLPKHPADSNEMMNFSTTISTLITTERNTMMTRAINSAKCHGINLIPGSPTPGLGDCAFEAAINNNNERNCFKEKFPLSISSYRQIWVTDMANRTANSEWNIYSTEEWLTGWQEMLVPGTCERGIYGDLMLPGIACGIRKFILIFNTDPQSPHDPIYVVDPRRFNVQPDTSIPILLAYNLIHYESLHPCTNADILATINLAKEYLENRYRYSRKDLPFLLGLEGKQTDQVDNLDFESLRAKKVEKSSDKKRNFVNFTCQMDKKDLKDKIAEKHENTTKENVGLAPSKYNRTDNTKDKSTLCYKLKHKPELHLFQEALGKLECPICGQFAKNIKLHFTKNPLCEAQIDNIHFDTKFKEYMKQKKTEKERLMKQNYRARKRNESTESYNELLEKNKQDKRNSRAKKRNESQEAYHELLERNNKDNRNFRKRKRDENLESYLELLKKSKQKSRDSIKRSVDEVTRRRNFSKAVIFGPIFTCSCCSRMLYENGVKKITPKFKEAVEKKRASSYKSCISKEILVNITFNGSDEKSGHYICHTCKVAMLSGKLPSMAVKNGLYLSKIKEGCELTEMENNLIAKNLNFQYIYCLPKSRWSATKNQMISVPIREDAVINTLQQLPRLPKDAGLIPVELKRKLEYKGCHRKEFIDPDKIYRVLAHLKESGHPYYQFFDPLTDFIQRCNKEDKVGYDLLFGDSNEEKDEDMGSDTDEDSTDESNSNFSSEDCDGESAENEEEEKEMIYITKDPVRKHQFDQNKHSCMTSNYPEIFLNENGERVTHNEHLSFAPGEGSYPTNILTEKDWEIKSWPALLPDGLYGLHHKRKVRLTDQQYFIQRILNKDLRFSKSPGYIFAAAGYIEQKQLASKANISFMRGKKTFVNGVNEYQLEDSFMVFEGVRNTPKYWQKVKYEMIAKLENIGPFHIFFTLSCGDKRYDENFTSFLAAEGYCLEYFVDPVGKSETRVKGKSGISKSLEDFLSEDIDESLHEMIRCNVLLATRNFHHRVVEFRNEVIMGKNNPMNVKYISYRVEFQARGAAHIHGTLWLNLKKIEKSPTFMEKKTTGKIGDLTSAFIKLRDEQKLSNSEKEAIAVLTDMFISCSLNPDIVTQEVVDIAREVNCHCCTRKCEERCKYGFPRFPLKETLVVDKHEFDDMIMETNSPNETKVNYTKILFDIEEILKDEEQIKRILSKYPIKGSTREESHEFRARRIDELLKLAGNISYDDYILAIKKSKKHASAVLLQRDVDEIYVNNYNQEWLLNWNANLDLQPVLDFFAVITYVTDYWAKPDEGLTPILKEAAKKLKSEPEHKKRCQQMANTFMTNRQMGEAEAYYKILPNLTLKYSNIETTFVPSDKKSMRSKFLMKLDENDINFTKGLKVKGGKDGAFLEKPDIIDKYCRRDMAYYEHLSELRPTQFAKMYEPISRNNKVDDDTDNESESDKEDARKESVQKSMEEEADYEDSVEYMVANYIISPDPQKQFILLPNTIKIKNPLPGEISIWRKRKTPKAIRVHKKQEDTDANRFFLSELLLYMPYTDENDLGCDDEEKCRNLYMENKENIQFVKRYLLPFAQGVEEARHYVQESMKNEDRPHNIGNTLDPEMEKESLECREEEEMIHPDFVQIHPDNFDNHSNAEQIKKTFKNIQIRTSEENLQDARKLDTFQKRVLLVAIKFAEDLVIYKKGKISPPKAPLLMVHGGAGSGKSTVIKVMSQYIHQILKKEGDDPECPYVLLSAFTGSAASNIDGQTLHTLFSFNFGAGFQSLSDQKRDLKRALYKNIKVLIIDEISLVDADMLYRIDLRLREITQKDMPFGNIAILTFGDLMQIKPVKGRYIMQCPTSKQFLVTYEIDSLWHKFEVIILEKNHRQGEDGHYADMLNRIRIGQQTPIDIQELKDRVRKKDHPDIKRENGALFLFGTNKKVNEMNNKRLKALKGKEIIIPAITLHKTIKNFNPPTNNAGNICQTPFQRELKLKIGAKVMLTYNVDTSDGLINGARGDLIGAIEDKEGNISKLIIKFDMESIGHGKRKSQGGLSQKYPGGTAIEKINYPFTISKSRKSVINTANVIQYPLKLAFACTGHKIQGATIPKPMKLIIYVMDIWMAAITYVMLSRICALSQLYILDEFDESKMYPSQIALEELERLKTISLNNNPTDWEKVDHITLKISSLNCRSLKKHIADIKLDDNLLKSNIICLQETWLDEDENTQNFEIPNYELHLNSNGRGKGLAIYFHKELSRHHEIDIKQENFQISMFSCCNIDVIVIYRSRNGSHDDITAILDTLIKRETPILILGDLNFCFLEHSSNSTRRFLNQNHFQQLVKEPTHIEGNLLDHAYVLDSRGVNKYTAVLHSKYYTDHRGVGIMVKRLVLIQC